MTHTTTAHPALMIEAKPARGRAAETARAIVELSKPRITRLVTMTSGVGFAMGVIGRSWTVPQVAWTGLGVLLGTAVSSGGANALNEWWERRRDALMERTAGRPLPSGRLSPGTGLVAGFAMSVLGVGILWAMCGVAAAAVSLATILIYVLCYTPMKPVTSLNTLVGAIPGALPPLIGWAAAAAMTVPHAWSPGAPGAWRGLAETGGWSLFVLMFVWQIPHFLAIAWMYKDDYAAGGYKMLSVGDETGRRTAVTMAVWAALLVPATLAPWWLTDGRLGVAYQTAALVSGAVYFVLTLRLCAGVTRPRARAVFLASIMHLPLLLVVMTVDAGVRALMAARN